MMVARDGVEPPTPAFSGESWIEIVSSKVSSSGTKEEYFLQLQSAKQLGVRRYDEGREAHCDCTYAHGQIEPPVDENARCDRDGDKVMAARPNHLLSGRRYQTRPKKTE
jgi:hypothetical protein